MSSKKQVFIKTFGCQMNVYDTGKMHALLAREGYTATDDMGAADLVIANTCSIREKPEHKLHSFLGEARHAKKAKNGGVLIAVGGCFAQQESGALLARYKDVGLVFGPDAIPKLGELVRAAEEEQVLDTTFLDPGSYNFSDELDPRAAGQIGAFVTIQKGCDNKCTFCIVPTTRGVEVSRPSAEIVDEVRRLVDCGVREITLIGQNVNSYGLKVPGEKTFAQLLRAVGGVPGVARIRYTTSHPRDMGPDVVQAYRDIPQLASHLHLPVQSGSDRVLRRMKRYYTRARYLDVVRQLQEARPGMVFSTDFITGFPGETDEDFDQTMELLEAVRFTSSFSFKYSPRPGTPALKLLERGEEVPAAVAQARLVRLQARQREIALAHNQSLEGRVVTVLVEGPSRHDAGVICGRTSDFKTINFPGQIELVGQSVAVRVVRAFTNSLRGELAAGGVPLRPPEALSSRP